jgi:uncharacterized protein YjbJ (UPF0337 family)
LITEAKPTVLKQIEVLAMADRKSPVAKQVAGNWKQFTGQLKETWGDLTDDELDQYEGRMEQLGGYIEERTGGSRSAIRSNIDEIAKRAKNRA